MFDSRYYAMVFTKNGELLYECFGSAISESSARNKAETLFNEKAHYVPSLKKKNMLVMLTFSWIWKFNNCAK